MSIKECVCWETVSKGTDYTVTRSCGEASRSLRDHEVGMRTVILSHGKPRREVIPVVDHSKEALLGG